MVYALVAILEAPRTLLKDSMQVQDRNDENSKEKEGEITLLQNTSEILYECDKTSNFFIAYEILQR